MAPDAAVELDSLTHHYGQRCALAGITLDVAPATIFSLLGPNGSGKSTLFRILATLLTPSGGTARIGGCDVTTQQDEVRRRIGVVFQQPGLDGKLTVWENLRHQGQLYGLSGKSLRRRATELLEQCGVNDRANDRVETLSGGLKRRIELAKALLHEPTVLILDEPSTGLDPAARTVLMDHLHELRERDGVTTLLTTHLMDEADRCDRIAILDEGRLVAVDTPDALKTSVGGEVLTISTDDPATLVKRARLDLGVEATVVDGTMRIEHDRGHAFVPKLIEAYPGEIKSVTVGRPTLDDVFVHLTGRRLWNEGNNGSENS